MKRIALLALVCFSVALSAGAACHNPPPFPNPKVALLSKGPDGAFTRYWFTVSNRAQYANALFVASPALPPCGLNNSASRTWLRIYDQNGQYIYGYCALSSNAQMTRLSFAVPSSAVQPKLFSVTLEDRLCARTVKSNLVPIP
jgi:hypothetical protein